MTRRSVSIDQSKLVPATIVPSATTTTIPSTAPKIRKSIYASTSDNSNRRTTRKSINANMLKVMKATVVSSPAKLSKPNRKSVIPAKPKTPLRRKTMAGPTSTITKPDDLSVFRNPAAKASLKCKICNKTFLQKTNLIAHEKTHNESTNKCKYCDKTFSLKTALSNHILKNCEKISSSQRRKLLISSTAAAATPSTSRLNVAESTRSRSRTTSSESSSKSLTPKSSAKKKEAHSGIFRTPKKPISCYTCKIVLPDILSFVDHAATHTDNDSN